MQVLPSEGYWRDRQQAKDTKWIPVIGIAGERATITLWMANRGIGEGDNILSDGTYYRVVINPEPKNVDGGVLLWDLSPAEIQSWKTAQKPVLAEPKDPEHDRDWPDMAPSITSNMATIVWRVLIRQEERETNIPIIGPRRKKRNARRRNQENEIIQGGSLRVEESYMV